MLLVQNPAKIDELILQQRKSGTLCEKLLSKIYHYSLKPGDTFIDVGSRVGHHLFPMGRLVGTDGHGLGIEANPTMAEGLREKIKANNFSHLTIAAVAAGEEEGEANFFVMEQYTGWSSLYEQHVHPNEAEAPKEIRVKLQKIDDIFAASGWSECHFMKLDIEHAEFPAMRGARNVCEQHRPLIVFENSPKAAAKLNNYTSEDFFGFFKSINYSIYDIFFNVFDEDRWKNDKMLPSYYVAAPKDLGLANDEAFLSEYDAHLQSLITN